MKRFLLPLAAVLLTMVMIIPSAMHISAADTSSDNIPDNAVVTYGYLEVFKEQLKQEILDELTAEGGITASTPYSDISAKSSSFLKKASLFIEAAAPSLSPILTKTAQESWICQRGRSFSPAMRLNTAIFTIPQKKMPKQLFSLPALLPISR